VHNQETFSVMAELSDVGAGLKLAPTVLVETVPHIDRHPVCGRTRQGSD